MNRHVVRAARLRRNELIRTWIAALLTALIMGIGLAQVHAQDFTPPISNGTFQAVGTNTNVSAGAATAAIAGVAGQWSYLCGWSVFSNGATVAQTANITVGPVQGPAGAAQTLTYPQALPTLIAAGTALINSGDKYWTCLRSSTLGGSITVTAPAAAGNTQTTIDAYGFTGQ